MTALTAVAVVIVLVAVTGVAWAVLAVLAVAAERRQQRRLMLQRALVVQAADQRMRSIGRAAVSAMLFEMSQRQGRGR